jgi:putative ubiquitin-RnfH superfamily antitoxin RatB of RatAB toxin-antitoxin module
MPSRSAPRKSMALLKVEVVYALPEREESALVTVQSGATVRDVLAKSGLLHLARGKLGIFGKVVREDAPVADGDRVEIYRPLAVDPKEARRARAATYTSRSRRAGFARSPSRAGRRR